MISQIDLRHFKCFETLKLPLCPLTLLSGGNASGKSTVMQALALLHQTMRQHEWSSRLMLNGETIRLGTTADVVDKVYGRRECEIGLLEGSSAYNWVFAGEREDMAMQVTQSDLDMPKRSPPTVTMEDLDRIIGSRDLMAPSVKIQPMGHREYSLLAPGMDVPLRVTTDPAYFEEHSESVELWSPGNPLFVAPELSPPEAMGDSAKTLKEILDKY